MLNVLVLMLSLVCVDPEAEKVVVPTQCNVVKNQVGPVEQKVCTNKDCECENCDCVDCKCGQKVKVKSRRFVRARLALSKNRVVIYLNPKDVEALLKDKEVKEVKRVKVLKKLPRREICPSCGKKSFEKKDK